MSPRGRDGRGRGRPAAPGQAAGRRQSGGRAQRPAAAGAAGAASAGAAGTRPGGGTASGARTGAGPAGPAGDGAGAGPDRFDPADDGHDTLVDVPGGVRLQKVLAAAGIGSRRHCEEMIGDGRVEVDGEIVRRYGARVDPQHQIIRVDGRRIPGREDLVYLALNKPAGVLTTMSDSRAGRPSPTTSATAASAFSTSAGSITTPRA